MGRSSTPRGGSVIGRIQATAASRKPLKGIMLVLVWTTGTDALGATVGTVPGTVHGVVRRAYSTASHAPTPIAIRRSSWRPTRAARGEPILIAIHERTRGATLRLSSDVTCVVTAGADRVPVCSVVCLPTRVAFLTDQRGSGRRSNAEVRSRPILTVRSLLL